MKDLSILGAIYFDCGASNLDLRFAEDAGWRTVQASCWARKWWSGPNPSASHFVIWEKMKCASGLCWKVAGVWRELFLQTFCSTSRRRSTDVARSLPPRQNELLPAAFSFADCQVRPPL